MVLTFQDQRPEKRKTEKRKLEKQNTYGFFRILTLGVLVVMGFLMLGENLSLFRFYVGDLALSNVYPVVIILSTVILRNYKRLFGKIFGLLLFLLVFGGLFSVGIYTSLDQYSKSKFSQAIKHGIYKSSILNFSVENFIGSINLKGDKVSKFVEGIYKSDRNLYVNNYVSGSLSSLVLIEEKNRNILQDYKTDLELKINKNQAIDFIYIKNLLGQHIIDMSDISRKEVKVHLGLADLNLLFSDNVLTGNLFQIQSVASNIKIQVPDGVGIRLYSKYFLGYMVGDLIKKGDDYYESTNINSAKKVINLDLKSAVSLIDVVRISN